MQWHRLYTNVPKRSTWDIMGPAGPEQCVKPAEQAPDCTSVCCQHSPALSPLLSALLTAQILFSLGLVLSSTWSAAFLSR